MSPLKRAISVGLLMLAAIVLPVGVSGGLGCGRMPNAHDVHSVVQILDDVCQIVDVMKVDPLATELCVDERQITDVLRVLLNKQSALPPGLSAAPASPLASGAAARPLGSSTAPPAAACEGYGASAPRPVRLRLPEGKTVADLQKGRLLP
jgi:hypothetical protein